ncbi:unnamed protein product [Aphanomyces euteiches]|uniref:PRELI/MSF1 domain-containing protein n=1 Tax=Aphanomyces euteiches TaxID=100861 RepID=A0A6G0XIJ2_9STRA|nr:hypothetical protein Ae201684_004546 [Aphanomyces euteiches]KAH9094082.1 hypothetical protein Ae201684P_016698 [Aphanomyces euteiches]KAH9134020.1 hypothetical protein AeRB84_020110 [Aphanomyces euteiches]
MKGRTQRTEHVYPHGWDVVTQAFWRKYPNPMLPHVEKMEVISRFLDEQGRLHTARLGVCTPTNLPEWAEVILGRHSFVYEETVCDPHAKTLQLKSTNLSYRSVAVVNEDCHYNSLGPSATKYVQSSHVQAFVPLLSRQFETFWVERGNETAAAGLRAMETLCQAVEDTTTAGEITY